MANDVETLRLASRYLQPDRLNAASKPNPYGGALNGISKTPFHFSHGLRKILTRPLHSTSGFRNPVQCEWYPNGNQQRRRRKIRNGKFSSWPRIKRR